MTTERPLPELRTDSGGVVSRCESAYTAWTGLTLRCTGDHLRGNIRRGEVHQQRYAGVVWTWYSDEADRTVDR